MTTTSRIPVWLGLVLAALTSLLPLGGVTVCLGHEVSHHGHTHAHSHGLVVAVGTDHAGCVCHGEAPERPDTCERCPNETHRCTGFAVERPQVASVEDPVRGEGHVASPRVLGVALALPASEAPRAARARAHRAHDPPPRARAPRPAAWLERSTVLIL